MRARELTEVEWEDSYLEHAYRSETILLSTSRNLVKSAIKGAMEDIHKIREERLIKKNTEMLKDTEEAFKDRQKRRELAKFKAEEMKKARKKLKSGRNMLKRIIIIIILTEKVWFLQSSLKGNLNGSLSQNQTIYLTEYMLM